MGPGLSDGLDPLTGPLSSPKNLSAMAVGGPAMEVGLG